MTTPRQGNDAREDRKDHVQPARGLAIFDLDGTLLQTGAVDEECYAQAVEDVFGIRGISTDWGSYTDSTDGGILDDLLRAHLGRAMTADDVLAHQRRFVELLDAVAGDAPHRFAATTGARAALDRLRAAGWTCALATGGWRPSALLKLRVAGLDLSDLPAAFADDHRSRVGIIRCAARRAGLSARLAGREGASAPRAVERMAYVGDGVWDLHAARSLGIGFIGLASGERAGRLAQAGARHVLGDFGDPETFLAHLDDVA